MEVAGRLGDGLVSLAPASDLLSKFDEAGGGGKPRFGQVEVCWAPDEQEAIRIAHEWWPNTALGGELTQELRTPAHFEQAVSSVRPDDVAEKVACGPDPERHAAAVREYADAGYDHVYIHQVGPDQEGFIRFCTSELLPLLQREPARAA